MDLKNQLQTGLAQLDLSLDDNQVTQLLDFVALLQKWNKTYNLTAVRAPERMISDHLLDSLSIDPHLHGQNIADIGTGAGLPGVPLAIANPGKSFLLLDSNSKKTRFIQHAVGQLGIENVTVRHGRSEDYPAEPGFDTVVCRALAALPKLIEIGGHLVRPNGVFVAQKGLLPSDELVELPQAWIATDARIQVPYLESKARHVVIMRRVNSE